jgi:hypothetical protein
MKRDGMDHFNLTRVWFRDPESGSKIFLKNGG